MKLGEIFPIVLPTGEYCIYHPFENSIIECDGELFFLIKKLKENSIIFETIINNNQIMEIFQKNKFIEIDDKITLANNSKFKQEKEYPFRQITILPTSDCNMRCIYCYSNGGDSKKYVSWATAKKALDFIMDQLPNDQKNFYITFHGGGEPTLNFDLIKKCMEYVIEWSKKKNIIPRGQISTNGILTDEIIDFLCFNNMRIIYSIDGPPDIQNFQRPSITTKLSYNLVTSSLKKLIAKGANVDARVTITDYSVNRMCEILQHLAELGIKNILMEPINICGRGKENNLNVINPLLFSKKAIECLELADKYKIRLQFSSVKIGALYFDFCGVSGKNFCLTPDGLITACFEVSNLNDPGAEIFIYGKYDATTDKIIIDKSKLDYLKERKNINLHPCKNCFCKWHCGGYCSTKAYRKYGTIMTVNEEMCLITQQITLWQLNKLFHNKSLS